MQYKLLIVLIVFSLSACNSRKRADEVVNTPTSIGGSTSSSDVKNAWNYTIDPPKVGLISTKNLISDIYQLLPADYKMMKDSASFEHDDESVSSTTYTVSKKDKIVFEITPDNDGNKIRSIVISDPDYQIINTELHVGSTLKTLKKYFSIKDSYFDIADGLYIYCNGFDGAFSIDLDGKGDEYTSIESLTDDHKVKSIIIY